MQLTPYQQALVDAQKLAEDARRKNGLAPRNFGQLFVVREGKKGKSRQFVGVRRYKITFWASPPMYADIMRQKAAEGHTGSFQKFLESLVERSCPPIAARPEPRAAKKAQPLGAARLRNGSRKAWHRAVRAA